MAWQRNLLIILTHGLRSDAISDGSRGAAWPLNTPNLLKLGNRGLRLVASSLCPADRGGMFSLLTGLHARQHGHIDTTGPAPLPCEGFPAWLHDNGYHLAGVGCVDLIERWLDKSILVADVSQPEPARCDYWTAARVRGISSAIRQQRKQRLRFGPFDPDRLMLEPDNDVDGFITAEACRMIDELPGDKPWALIVAYSGPGNDLPPPPLYENIVDPSTVEAGFCLPDFTTLDALAELDYPRTLLQRLEPHKLGRIRADYLGRVSLIDYGVGRLTTAMQQRLDVTRTWTVIASDRGHLLGEHGLVGHRSFLCPAIETPLLIRAPRAVRINPPDLLVSTADVAVTIAALAGADVPTACTGRSLLPIFNDQPVMPDLHGGLLSEFGRRLMLETERHKIIFDTAAHRPLGLYDLLNDLDERENLIDTIVGRNLLDSMRWRLGDALMPLRAAVA